jgi:hypothetical protein
MAERQRTKAAGAGETETPPMTTEQFEASPEFKKLKSAMRRLLKVPKAELDKRVTRAKSTSPRAGNPNAPGRKPSKKHA